MPCAITFNTQWYGSSLSHQDYREKQDLIRISRFSNLEKIRFCNCSIRISSLGLYEENIRFSFSIRIPWFFQTEQTVNREKSGFRTAQDWHPYCPHFQIVPDQNHSLKKLSRIRGCPHFIRTWSKKNCPGFQDFKMGTIFLMSDSDIRKSNVRKD